MNPVLSIIIPAYNEARSIQAVLDKVASSLKFNEISAQIIVVDDASTDQTIEKVQRFCYPKRH